MAEEDDALEGMDDLEEMDALEAAVSGDESGEEELDPLAEEMLKMMEEKGDDEGEGGGEDLDQMMEMEMLKAMEEEGGGAAADDALQVGAAGVDIFSQTQKYLKSIAPESNLKMFLSYEDLTVEMMHRDPPSRRHSPLHTTPAAPPTARDLRSSTRQR